MSLVTSPTIRGRAQSLPEWDAYKDYNYLDMNFGHGSGVKLLDKSPFHAHGDITTATWANGLHHRCLDFNPDTPDYVEIPASFTQLDFTSSEDFSLIATIYVDDLSALRTIFSRGEYNANGWFLRVGTVGRLEVFTFQSGAAQASYSTAGDIVVLNWCTVGLSRVGASIRLYVNGVDVTSTVGTHIDPTSSSAAAKIGVEDSVPIRGFDGKIEFLRIFGGIALPAEAHAWFHSMLK